MGPSQLYWCPFVNLEFPGRYVYIYIYVYIRRSYIHICYIYTIISRILKNIILTMSNSFIIASIVHIFLLSWFVCIHMFLSDTPIDATNVHLRSCTPALRGCGSKSGPEMKSYRSVRIWWLLGVLRNHMYIYIYICGFWFCRMSVVAYDRF